MRPPVLMTNDGIGSVLLPDGTPGAGGFFVSQMHNLPSPPALAQGNCTGMLVTMAYSNPGFCLFRMREREYGMDPMDGS